MRRIVSVLVLASLLAPVCSVLGQDQGVAPQVISQADRLAAASLRHSAFNMVHSPADVPARGARLVAMTRFSDRLLGGDLQTHRLFIQIYQMQDEPKLAAGSAEVLLGDAPADYRVGSQWLAFQLSALDDAAARLEFLQSTLQREDLAATVRAESGVEAARIYVGQGELDQARQALEAAVELNPNNLSALESLIELAEGADPINSAQAAMAWIRARPGDPNRVMALIAALESVGLYAQALEVTEYLSKIVTVERYGSGAVASILQIKLDLLLSAGRFDDAVDAINDVSEDVWANDFELALLVIEAYRAYGLVDKANELIQQIRDRFDNRFKESFIPASAATELAWLHLLFTEEYDQALKYATQVVKHNYNDEIARMLQGMAEISVGQGELGKEHLRPLADKFAYAGVYLAEQYDRDGDEDAFAIAIDSAASLPRSGAAQRRLADLAKTKAITLPPAAGVEEVQALYEALDKGYFELGLDPGKHISATIKAVKDVVAVGEPVEIEVTLTNTGPVAVTLGGQQGLFVPEVVLRVELVDRPETSFGDLPKANLAAPRYLPPGESLTSKVRLDVGPMGRYLATHPLDEVNLKVVALLSPIRVEAGLSSSIGAVSVEPIQIKVNSLLRPFDRSKRKQWAHAYRQALGYIVGDIKKGDLDGRMRAARQVGALLAMIAEAENYEIRLPWQLKERISKPVVLSMMVAVLEDPSEVVRAEMLAALDDVNLDASVIGRLGSAITDDSSLVRFRLAELFVINGGQKPVLEHLSADADALVQLMATSAAITAGR